VIRQPPTERRATNPDPEGARASDETATVPPVPLLGCGKDLVRVDDGTLRPVNRYCNLTNVDGLTQLNQ
jgi:hypothetical protein